MQKYIISTVLVLLAIILVPTMFNNTTGGISGVIKVIGIGGALITFLRPTFGIYLIALETCYLDYFKKLGTYHGMASQLTVIEILSMSMLTIGMLWAAMIIRIALSGFKLRRAQWNLLIGVVLVAVMLLAINGANAKALQDIVNGAGILGIALALTLYYKDPKVAAIKYLRILLIILLPWPLMGLYQSYFDYSQMDYWYSNTGLSVTNKSLEVLSAHYGFRPPLGFGSSTYAFAVTGAMYGLSLWHAIVFKEHRKKFIMMFLLCFIAILHTEARTAMILPLLIVIFFLVLRKKLFAKVAFGVGIMIFFGVIIFSESLSDWIKDNNDAFVIEGYESKMTLNTLQARLIPLMQLKDPENWSFLGVATTEEVKEAEFGDRFFSHNFLTKILYTTGAAGFAAFLIPGMIAFLKILKFLERKRDYLSEAMTRYGIAFLLPFIGLNLLGGTGISTQPSNIIMAAIVGLLVCSNMPNANENKITH